MKDKQVGGGHYKTLVIEPWEYAEANKLTFLEGNAIKYISRHRLKNGKEDLMKALHCIELLIEHHYQQSNDRTKRLPAGDSGQGLRDFDKNELVLPRDGGQDRQDSDESVDS